MRTRSKGGYIALLAEEETRQRPGLITGFHHCVDEDASSLFCVGACAGPMSLMFPLGANVIHRRKPHPLIFESPAPTCRRKVASTTVPTSQMSFEDNVLYYHYRWHRGDTCDCGARQPVSSHKRQTRRWKYRPRLVLRTRRLGWPKMQRIAYVSETFRLFHALPCGDVEVDFRNPRVNKKNGYIHTYIVYVFTFRLGRVQPDKADRKTTAKVRGVTAISLIVDTTNGVGLGTKWVPLEFVHGACMVSCSKLLVSIPLSSTPGEPTRGSSSYGSRVIACCIMGKVNSFMSFLPRVQVWVHAEQSVYGWRKSRKSCCCSV